MARIVDAIGRDRTGRLSCLASNKGFVVDSYEDNAAGRVEKNAKGKLAVTYVESRPKIRFGGDKQPAQADLDWLHDKAHRECFIANAVTTEGRGRGLTMIRTVGFENAGRNPSVSGRQASGGSAGMQHFRAPAQSVAHSGEIMFP